MDERNIRKVFPNYFKNFQLPSEAREQEIVVYRACRSHKLDKESFMNTYEENGFKISVGKQEDDPQEYCMSTCFRLKDIRRFVVIDSKFQPPLSLAKGKTSGRNGVSCITKEWKPSTKSSHVDYWLYENATPWEDFEMVDYENEKNISEEK